MTEEEMRWSFLTALIFLLVSFMLGILFSQVSLSPTPTSLSLTPVTAPGLPLASF